MMDFRAEEMFRRLRPEHDGLPVVDNRVESSIITTSWIEWNSSVLQTRPPIPICKVNIDQNDSLADSRNVNGKETFKNDKQPKLNDRSPIYKNIYIVNKQRPSVIKRVGKPLPFEKGYSDEPTTDQPSLPAVDVKYHAKSCLQEDTKQGGFRGRSVDVDVAATVSSQASSSVPNLESTKKKYHCQFCSKSFQWHSHWQAHERIHTGERPFKCEECSKAFTRSDGLQCHKLTHMKRNISSNFTWENSKHETGNSLKFENCKLALKNRDTFEQHTIMHKEKSLFKCQFCPRTFLSSTRLVRHVRGHKGEMEFKCDCCDMAFNKKSALEIHSRVHTGVRPYRCNICTKAFSIHGNLKRHLLIHTDERPYVCSTCSSSFNNPSHLTRHIKNKHRISNSAPSDNKGTVHSTRPAP